METAVDDEFKAALTGLCFSNAASIGRLWRAHQPALVGWLRSFDQEHAEDIASDAWIEAVRAAGTFSGDERQFRSWLFTIARRRLIDRTRRSERQRQALEKMGVEPPVAAANPESITEATSSTQYAITLVTRLLSRDQAEVVLLRVIAGLDVDQVAMVIGKNPGAVRVLQHRGLRKLAEHFEKPAIGKPIQEFSGKV